MLLSKQACTGTTELCPSSKWPCESPPSLGKVWYLLESWVLSCPLKQLPCHCQIRGITEVEEELWNELSQNVRYFRALETDQMWFSSELKWSQAAALVVGLDDFFGFPPYFSDFSGAAEKGFINFQQEERAVCILLLLSTESKPCSPAWKPPPQLWASFSSARSWFGCTQHCCSIINRPGQINQ